jgi:signal transduction histidine kinase
VNDNDCALTGDTKRLQQVLINLLGNSCKFTEKGKISVTVVQGKDNVVFHVKDTGIGIPQDHVSRVFEAFHQVDNSSGRKFGGTGLGLAISRDIAQAHGGDLTASSVEGKGSTFTLTLPKRFVEHDAEPGTGTQIEAAA